MAGSGNGGAADMKSRIIHYDVSDKFVSKTEATGELAVARGFILAAADASAFGASPCDPANGTAIAASRSIADRVRSLLPPRRGKPLHACAFLVGKDGGTAQVANLAALSRGVR